MIFIDNLETSLLTLGQNFKGGAEMVEFNIRRIRAERIARGISVKEMADALDITPGTYYKKESGTIRLNVDDLAIILNVLGMSENECGIFFTHNVSKMATT